MSVLIEGSDLPDFVLNWSENGEIVDLSVLHSYVLTVTKEGEDTPAITKGSGITGAATLPNATIVWEAGERSVLTEGTYRGRLVATRASDGRARIFPFSFRIAP